MFRAVAIDFGATSGRYAAGRLEDGRIEFDVVRQVPHHASEESGTLFWDLETLLGLCNEAADYAAANGGGTIGIDSWGVDHGFLDLEGNLLQPPVCYRDLSHLTAFESLAAHREELYRLTGIQHQPFNTICQLIARRKSDPSFLERSKEWFILPDLLGYLLTGERHHEFTQASTTQLLGLDGKWSAEAFALAGWSMPSVQPTLPGTLGGEVRPNVRLAHVGSHDTASAVAGFGVLGDDEMFLNVGTWSLVGCVIDQPIATKDAEAANLTNERTVDGRVRLLKNVPGFYVINRIHEELGIGASVPEWLSGAVPTDSSCDLLHPDFFNPESMTDTVAALSGFRPDSDAEWAGLALASLAGTLVAQPKDFERLTGRSFRRLRVGGGGSQSVALCEALAKQSGLEIVAGPVEATVLGNLAVQFLAQGAFQDFDEMARCVSRSAQTRTYRP